MMSVVALSLIALYVGMVTAEIILMGYLFNFIL